MNMNPLFLLVAALITGAVVPFQAGANAFMGRSLGHPLWGAAVSLLVSIICIVPIMALVFAGLLVMQLQSLLPKS